MIKAVVLSNERQYRAFIAEKVPFSSELLVFCDNESFYDFLEDKKILFQRLDDFTIKEHWKSINEWGCGKAAGWIKQCEAAGLLKEKNFASTIYMFFSTTLILSLKNYYFARYLLQPALNVREAYIFKASGPVTYPNYSGNALLNLFLTDEARKKGVPVRSLRTEPPLSAAPLRSQVSVWRSFLKGAVLAVYSFFVRPGRSCDLLVSGSPRHLGSVMLELKKKRGDFFFFDFDLFRDNFLFCLKNGIPYLTLKSFGRKIRQADSELFASKLMNEVSEALDHPSLRDFFIYEGENFMPFIKQVLVPPMEGYALTLCAESGVFLDLLDRFPLKGVLVDEDIAQKAFLAGFMNARGVKIFCPSHADIAFDFAVKDGEKGFCISETFVNSENEKAGYTARGWDPAGITLLGVPRYDRLIRMSRVKKTAAPKNEVTLFFCAAMPFKYDPDRTGYMGLDICTFGWFQTAAVAKTFEAIRGLPVRFVLKPHYETEKEIWEKVIKELKPGNPVQIVSHAADFFKLLLEADVMVLSYWSTALIEAGMAGVPAIYLNMSSQISPSIIKASKNGLCKIALDPNGLREEIEKLCRFRPLSETSMTPEARNYYLGKTDGNSSARVAKRVIAALSNGGAEINE